MSTRGTFRTAGRTASTGGGARRPPARPSMWRFARVAPLVALSLLGGGLGVALGSCSDAPGTAAPGGGAAGGHVGAGPADAGHDQATGAGGAGATAGDGGGTGGTLPCGLPYAEAWAPGVESCFRPVDWAAPCNVQVAEQPHLAVPPLEWEPCGWQPGCERVVVKWEYEGNAPVPGASVVRGGDGHRVSLALGWKDEDGAFTMRVAVYDTNGEPQAVWRGQPPYCNVGVPMLASERMWLDALALDDQGGMAATYIAPGYADLAIATEVLPVTTPSQGSWASDDLLLLWGMDGRHMTVYDRLSGTTEIFGSASYPSYMEGEPLGNSALMTCFDEFDRPKLCIWNRSTQAIEPLVSPPSEVVPVAESDGQTLVWAQNPPVHQPNGAWEPGALWTSPMATQAADVVADKRCAAPDISYPYSTAGEGYLALTAVDPLQHIHIYRLSDMHHWSIPAPPAQDNGTIGRLVHIDSELLWYNTHYLNRQRLDALGPGEPCPAPP